MAVGESRKMSKYDQDALKVAVVVVLSLLAFYGCEVRVSI
jgi:hypothetical protein